MKKEQKKITISVDAEIYEKLEKEGYNKSKVVNILLSNYFQKTKKKKQENS